MSVPPVDLSEVDDHGEQAMIERLYIKTANDVLGSALGQLQQALQTSTALLQTLDALQRQKNMLEVESRTVSTDYPTDGSAYNEFASANFGQPIVPTLSDDFDPSQVEALRDQLANQLAQLQQIVGSAASDPNGLYQQGLKVLTDIDQAGAAAWVMDHYDDDTSSSSSKAGDYQNHLALAITAGQSLSDTQKEEVRRYLFVFEEYYKSAGAMLSKITGIIERMAQNISRG